MTGDLRAALRALTESATFTAAAVLVLALGIGATSALYAVVDAVAFRQLPFADAGRLVGISEVDPAEGPDAFPGVAPQNFADWAAAQRSFTAMAAYRYILATRYEPGTSAEELLEVQATAGIFEVLGFQTAAGRVFDAGQEVEGRNRVAVVSHGFWQRVYGGDPAVLGRALTLDDIAYEIVGVLGPDDVYPPGSRQTADVYVPFVPPADQRLRAGTEASRSLEVIARLAPGHDLAGAAAELRGLHDGLRRAHPGWVTTHVQLQGLRDFTVGARTRAWMLLLIGAAVAVLLAAATNVAILQLARASRREHEMGVRLALGGGRWRLVRQLLVENLVLVAIGAGAGLLLAVWGVGALRQALPPNLVPLGEIAVDWRVVAVTVAVAAATGLGVGVAPALHLSAPLLASSIRHPPVAAGSGRSRHLRRGLMLAEVAVAVVLLVGASLFTRSFLRVNETATGFDSTHLLLVNVSGTESGRRRADLTNQYRALPEALQSPAILAAAVVTGSPPLAGGRFLTTASVGGRPVAETVGIRMVTPRFHDTLRVPIVAGRGFTAADDRGGPAVAIVNESFVRRYLPEGSPLGRTVETLGAERLVVGVAGDIRALGREFPVRPEIDLPLGARASPRIAALVVRTTGDPAAVLPDVRRAASAVLPGIAVRSIRTADEALARQIAQRRFNMLLLSLFGALGALLTGVGLFGTAAYGVERRTREIGIRRALGASSRAIVGW